MMELLLNLIAKPRWVLAPFVSLLSSRTHIRVGNGWPFGLLDDADGCQLAFSLSSAFHQHFIWYVFFWCLSMIFSFSSSLS